MTAQGDDCSLSVLEGYGKVAPNPTAIANEYQLSV